MTKNNKSFVHFIYYFFMQHNCERAVKLPAFFFLFLSHKLDRVFLFRWFKWLCFQSTFSLRLVLITLWRFSRKSIVIHHVGVFFAFDCRFVHGCKLKFHCFLHFRHQKIQTFRTLLMASSASFDLSKTISWTLKKNLWLATKLSSINCQIWNHLNAKPPNLTKMSNRDLIMTVLNRKKTITNRQLFVRREIEQFIQKVDLEIFVFLSHVLTNFLLLFGRFKQRKKRVD